MRMVSSPPATRSRRGFVQVLWDCGASEARRPLVVFILIASVFSAGHLAQERVVYLVGDAVLFLYLFLLGKCIWAKSKGEVHLRWKASCWFMSNIILACVLVAFDVFQYPPRIEDPHTAARIWRVYRGREFTVKAKVIDRSPGLICEWDTEKEPGPTGSALVIGPADRCEEATFKAVQRGPVTIRITAKDFWGWSVFSASQSETLQVDVVEKPP